MDDNVFQYEIGRNCRRNKYCMQLSTAQLPTANAWALIYRTYLEPATKTAPKLSEIYSPTVLQFTCNAGREGGEIDVRTLFKR